MSPTERFKVTISLNVVKEDGTPFFDSAIVYSAMPYPGMVFIERKMVDLLADLVAKGEQEVAAMATATL